MHDFTEHVARNILFEIIIIKKKVSHCKACIYNGATKAILKWLSGMSNRESLKNQSSLNLIDMWRNTTFTSKW